MPQPINVGPANGYRDYRILLQRHCKHCSRLQLFYEPSCCWLLKIYFKATFNLRNHFIGIIGPINIKAAEWYHGCSCLFTHTPYLNNIFKMQMAFGRRHIY